MLPRRCTVLAFAAALLPAGIVLADHSSYRLRVSAAPAPAVGQTSRAYLRVYRPDGVQVRRFDDLHTQAMHLIAVSRDLEHFQHVHPVLLPWGYLRVDLSFARATPYVLFAEYDPLGPASERMSRQTIWPAGAQPAAAALNGAAAFDGSNTRQATRDGTQVTLVGAPGQRIRRGVATSLHVRVDDPTGAPVALSPYMGMPAHAIVVSEDVRDFMHLHGMITSGSSGMTSVVHDVGGHGGHGGATTPSAQTVHLAVEATFPRAGLYMLWVQVNRDGRVLTVPFVVRAGS